MASANDRAGIAAPTGRIMVSLSTSPAAAEALHQVAAHLGYSVAQLLRTAVEQFVEGQSDDALSEHLAVIREANKRTRPRASSRYRHRSDYSYS